MNFGEQIKVWRRRRGIGFGALCGLVGLQNKRLSAIERGAEDVNLHELARLAEALDCRWQVVLKPRDGSNWRQDKTKTV